MLRIVEGPAFSVSKSMRDANIDFNIFQNCIWCVLVTMTTVGYGDYYPSTNLGRLIIIITAIIGNIIISLIIVSMQNIFMFTENEKKVSLT
jgi:voltage-gated potassium channel Kch